MSDSSPKPMGSDDERLLRELEQRLDGHEPPMQVLADLLAGRNDRRMGLFQRAGETVLGYRLVRILGAGGMGVTYAGMGADGSEVAVKLVADVTGAVRERFEQECRLLRSLEHSAIVRYRASAVLDDDCGVLVMHLIRGRDLDSLLREALQQEPPTSGPSAMLLHEVRERGTDVVQSPRYRRRILRLLTAVAEGLHHSHLRGIVHRDIKPANILVRDDLEPAVIDFGLARDLQQKVSFTRSGAAMGTLAYIAPEQLGRDPGAVDARTDIYGIGLILYRALTGTDLRTEVADIVQHAQRPFLLDAKQSRTLPAHLQAILYRCLEQRREHRYADAMALAIDLRAAASDGKVAARPPGALALLARNPRKLALLCTIVLLAAVFALAPFWPRGRELVVQTTSPDVEMTIDGVTVKPFARTWLRYGKHEIAIVSNSPIPRTLKVDVVPGDGPQYETLRTRLPGFVPYEAQLGEQLAQVQFQTGHNLIAGIADAPVDDRFINGELQANRTFIVPRLPAGHYELAAKDRLGRSESIAVDIEAGDNVDVLLLPREMHSVDGRWRKTWASVLSPVPPGLSVSGTAARWAEPNSPNDSFGSGSRAVRCGFAAMSGSTSNVTMRMDFPEPMRSITMYLRAQRKLGAQVDIVVIGEHVPPRPWPLQADGTFDPYLRVQVPDGSRWLEVRAELQDVGRTQAEPYARMLDGVFCGGHWWSDPPCFAVVADPDPAPSHTQPAQTDRSDSATEAALAAAPQLPVPIEFAPAAKNESVCSGTCAFVRTPDGQLELLSSGLSVVDRNEAVHRHRWPSGEWLGALAVPGPKARSEPLVLLALPDEDGDGYTEFAIGDQASERNGGQRATILSGAVTIHDGRTGRELRSLKHDVSPTPAGDDHFGHGLMLCGDWDGDQRPELTISATGYMSNGKDHCGRVEVRSTRNPEQAPHWLALGSNVISTLSIAAVSRPASGKATIALTEIMPQILFTKEKFMVVNLFAPDLSGEPAKLTTKPGPAVAFLEATAGAPLRAAVTCSMSYFEGILVLERTTDGWREVQRQSLRGLVDPNTSHFVLAIPDQDGRGREDLVLVRSRSPLSPQVLLLAGEDLAVIALADTPADIETIYTVDWVEPNGGRPAELFALVYSKAPRNLETRMRGQRLRFVLPKR